MYKLVLVGLMLMYGMVAPSHGSVALFDAYINIDGTSTDLSGGPPAGVNDAGFNFTTGLGTIIATITGAGAHNVDVFVDHEIDEAINTFFNEFGSTSGAPAGGQSWEIDEPEFVFGDIFTNFSNSALDNTNGVPAGSEDDVSMALGWDFVLAAGQQATATFTVSDTAPLGFHLSHTDPDSNETIYFNSSLSIGNVMGPPPGGVVPEPASVVAWILLLGAVGTCFIVRRRKSS